VSADGRLQDLAFRPIHGLTYGRLEPPTKA
jgi:hypothetical protein